MLKFFILAMFSLVGLADSWSVICEGDQESYEVQIMKLKEYTSATINIFSNSGQERGSIEAFVKIKPDVFKLSIIEANSLRTIWVDKPTGDIRLPTTMVWAPSPYTKHFGGGWSALTCYDMNGMVPEVIEEIETSEAFLKLGAQMQGDFDVSMPKEIDYSLAMVTTNKDQTVFRINAQWSILNKDCHATFMANSDFTEVSIESINDGVFAECDY